MSDKIPVTLPKVTLPQEKPVFEKLSIIDISKHVEKKNGLSYLSWSWAWLELKKVYPDANYEFVKNPATNLPYFADATGAMCYCKVTAGGITHEMMLPVMDGANMAMKTEPYSYKVKEYKDKKWTGGYTEKFVEPYSITDINKTSMRCLVKAIAMFGLGLCLYAGEDLPLIVELIDQQEKQKLLNFFTPEAISAFEQQYGPIIGKPLADVQKIANWLNGYMQIIEVKRENGIWLHKRMNLGAHRSEIDRSIKKHLGTVTVHDCFDFNLLQQFLTHNKKRVSEMETQKPVEQPKVTVHTEFAEYAPVEDDQQYDDEPDSFSQTIFNQIPDQPQEPFGTVPFGQMP